jgi:peroxiredoxin
MIVATCLLACTLTAAQPPKPQAEGLRLSGGQELLYSGSFTEEICKQKAKIGHRFQIENRILILETMPTGAKVALLTLIQPEKDNANPAKAGLRSVCLQVAHLDLKGRLTNEQGERLELSIGSLPKTEGGCFVEMPADKTDSQREWVVSEAGKPRHYWRRTGIETIDGHLSYKLIGAQQSDDWDHPIAGKTAWRTQDTVWLAPQAGIAARYERILEQREPAGSEPSYRSTAAFHLESSLVYPGRLFHDRLAEIDLYRQYSQLAEACFREPGPYSPHRLEALSAKIGYHCDTQPPTPYREALLELQRRVETGSRGDLPPVPTHQAVQQVSAQVIAGSMAPDFVASDLVTNAQVRLQLLRGKPIMLLFYNPASASAAEILRFAQAIKQANQVHVLALSVAGGTAAATKQRNELGVEFPILTGVDLRSAYGIDATPKIIVIDGDGMIRRTFDGWGDETPALIRKELNKWSNEGSNGGKQP